MFIGRWRLWFCGGFFSRPSLDGEGGKIMEIDLVALEGMLGRQLKLVDAARALLRRCGLETEVLTSMRKETKAGLVQVREALAVMAADAERPLLN